MAMRQSGQWRMAGRRRFAGIGIKMPKRRGVFLTEIKTAHPATAGGRFFARRI